MKPLKKVNDWVVRYEKWKNDRKKALRFLASLGKVILLFVVFAWLIYVNRYDFLQIGHGQVKTWDDVKLALLNSSNVKVYKVAFYFGVASIMWFLIRLPFLKLETFKFLGLEYKTIVEKQEQIANEEVESLASQQMVRLVLLKKVSESQFYDIVATYIQQGHSAGRRREDFVQIDIIVEELADFIELWFEKSLDNVKIHSGVAVVQNGNLQDDDELSEGLIKRTVLKAKNEFEMPERKRKQGVYDSNQQYSVLAIPLPYADQSSYPVLYLESRDMKFAEHDLQMVLAAWETVQLHIKHRMREYDLGEAVQRLVQSS